MEGVGVGDICRIRLSHRTFSLPSFDVVCMTLLFEQALTKHLNHDARMHAN